MDGVLWPVDNIGHNGRTYILMYASNKILDQSQLKAFAENKIEVIQMAKFVLDMIENIVGKEENAGYQHFLFFPQCFQKSLSPGSLKVCIVW